MIAAFALSGLSALLSVPFVLGFVRYGSPLEYFRRQAFDRRAWRDPSPADQRLRMVDHLIDHVLQRGMTRAQIDALLGPATDTDKWREWDLVYHLGTERGLMGIDSEWLVLRFGADGTVVDFQLVRD